MDPLSLIAFATLVGAVVSGTGGVSDIRREQQLRAWSAAFRELGLREVADVSVAMDLFIGRGAHENGLPIGWRWLGDRVVRWTPSDPDDPKGLELYSWTISGEMDDHYALIIARDEPLNTPEDWEGRMAHDPSTPSQAVARAMVAYVDRRPEPLRGEELREALSKFRALVWSWNNSMHATWWPLDSESVLMGVGSVYNVDPWE